MPRHPTAAVPPTISAPLATLRAVLPDISVPSSPPSAARAEQTAQPSGGFHHIAKGVSRPLTGRGIRLLLSAESAVQLVAKPSQPAEAVAYLIE